MAAKLHLLCGKIAAGKSTLSQALSAPPDVVLMREDRWLSTLYPDAASVDDYRRYAAMLREIIGEHVAELLRAGLSIVLDWPANTVSNRRWMRGIIEASGAAHDLHFLDTPDAVCLARLHARNASGLHEYDVTDEQFYEISSYFEAPTPEEGLNIIRHLPE